MSRVHEDWNGIGHVETNFFDLDTDQLDVGRLAPEVADGFPVDADGSFLSPTDSLTGLP